MASKKIFAANWKLNKGPQETRDFFAEFKTSFKDILKSHELVFFPSAMSIEAASQSLKGTTISFGLQNSYKKNEGAFTGENSAQVLKSLGGKYVLVGHSERRQYFAETDEFLAEKIQFIQSLDLIPMYCIGESLNERETGETEKVLNRQILKGLSLVDKQKPLVLAYEPVWAIGTGRVASSAQVQETHLSVFKTLQSIGLEKTSLLYGGSVKADNARELISIPHVDGFLVGGASLNPSSFLDICACIEN